MNRNRWLHLALVVVACLLSFLLQGVLILGEPAARVVIELGPWSDHPAPLRPAGRRT